MSAKAIDHDVDALILALEDEYGNAALTPGGVSWLQVHYVPVRRLVSRVVRRLLTLHEAPVGPAAGEHQSFVVANGSASLGYVAYDVSEAGISYLLGHHDQEPRDEQDPAVSAAERLPARIITVPVCAVSWSSRHAETLLPVLIELANRGLSSTVVDLATEADQRFPDPRHAGITVLRLPDEVLVNGGPPAADLRAGQTGRTAWVGRYEISVARLALLVSQVLVRSAGCTQPSWAAALKAEGWLDRALAQLQPGVLLCSNDTSPLGVLAVRAAERVSADTVYVQHGAWVAGQVAWRAQHCRHIAVMGARDVVTAHSWTRRADARTYVVGQPRFDVLAKSDRVRQRAYLEKALADQAGVVPQRIAVWACQPFSEQRLLGQFDVLVEGLRSTARRWGLVIAPHPVQSTAAFTALLGSTEGVAVASAAPEVGARGCLSGADALVSASSTCGIEALLLDVPVLELTLPASRTLGLADQGAAQRCKSSEEITVALARIDRTPAAVQVPPMAKDSICRWDGRSATAIADIVTKALADGSAMTHSPQGTEKR